MPAAKFTGRIWREGYLFQFEEALSRARTGAALLDTTLGATWAERIDLDALDVLSPTRCILGQLSLPESLPADRFWQVFKQVCMPNASVASGFSCGFVLEMVGLLFRPARIVESYRLLTQAWKKVLVEKRFRRLRKFVTGRPLSGLTLASSQTSCMHSGRLTISELTETRSLLVAHSDA